MVLLLLLTFPAVPWQHQPRLRQLRQQRAAALQQLPLALLLLWVLRQTATHGPRLRELPQLYQTLRLLQP
jgi:hypothetical protein